MSFEVQPKWIFYWNNGPEHASQTAAILLCFPGPIFWSFSRICPIDARENASLF